MSTTQAGSTSYDVLPHATPEAIVIHCADPRFQDAFRSFVRNELKLEPGKYATIAISGAVATLSDSLALPKHAKVITDLLETFFERYPIKLVVLINHEDCKQYERMNTQLGRMFLARVATMAERQKIDLGKVAKMLLQLSKVKADTRMFYAKFANAEHTQCVFEEIKLQ